MTEKELEKKVWHQLGTIIDPELGIDIVSMGLIYQVSVTKKDHSWQISIEMTLTTVGCPLAGVIHAMIIQSISDIDPVTIKTDQIKINLVFDPPWTTAMMSQEARTKLEFLL